MAKASIKKGGRMDVQVGDIIYWSEDPSRSFEVLALDGPSPFELRLRNPQGFTSILSLSRFREDWCIDKLPLPDSFLELF
jgi:hypothetical protein